MSERLRIMVATGDSAGHVLPGVALTRALRPRGHDVVVQASERWRDPVERAGGRMLVVEEVAEVIARPTFDHRLVAAARALLGPVRDFDPDIVVSDFGAAAPPLAAELAGVPTASLIATLYPVQAQGLPIYQLGLMPPRTPVGRLAWRALAPLGRIREPDRWLREVPRRLNRVRDELGLVRLDGSPDRFTSYGMLSENLVLVDMLPQLEYPRRWPAHVHVTGPVLAKPPRPDAEPPAGDAPLVLVVPSGQDPERELIRVAIDALAREDMRIVAAMSERGASWAGAVPANAEVVDWISLADVLPQASLVICSGPGTVARALAGGVPVLVCPRYADQPEIGARVAWAGAGLMLPRRLFGRRSLRSAARRMFGDPAFAVRAGELAAWSREHDGATWAADLIERHARRR